MDEILKKIVKARTSLLMTQPFFATIACHLLPVRSTAHQTMATDGKHLFYNPEFVEKLTQPELIGVMAHEALHPACHHHVRRGNRDPYKWNVAADYAINPIVKNAGLDLPQGALISDTYKGKTAEQIYNMLPEEPDGEGGGGCGTPGQGQAGQQPGDQQSQDPGGCGGVVDATGPDGKQLSPDERAQLERDWKELVNQAAQAAKQAGKLPGGLEELIEDLREPKADYRELMRRFIDQIARNDYNWIPPNRRYIYQGMYLPSMRNEEVGPIVFAIDTSGSMNQDALEQAVAELRSIFYTVRPEVVYAVYCDTEVRRVDTFERDSYFEVKTAPGRGGTRFTPVFDWIEEQGIDPKCLLYFSDLYSNDYPNYEPDYPVLFITWIQDQVAKIGETVLIDEI